MPNEPDDDGWVSIGSLDDLWEGDIRGIDAAGHPLVVLRVGSGELRVFQGICPHQEQTLADGEFDGRLLTCFGHLWQFDALTGAGVNPSGCTLARYPVEELDGDVRVRIDGVHPNYWF